MFNNRAQGSLEYLIIVAAVLAIGAIVILFLTQSAGSGNTSALVAQCQAAASSCASTMMTSGMTSCSTLSTCAICSDARLVGKINSSNTSAYATAAAACNAGMPQFIIKS